VDAGPSAPLPAAAGVFFCAECGEVLSTRELFKHHQVDLMLHYTCYVAVIVGFAVWAGLCVSLPPAAEALHAAFQIVRRPALHADR
jgi:hypothetical protein